MQQETTKRREWAVGDWEGRGEGDIKIAKRINRKKLILSSWGRSLQFCCFSLFVSSLLPWNTKTHYANTRDRLVQWFLNLWSSDRCRSLASDLVVWQIALLVTFYSSLFFFYVDYINVTVCLNLCVWYWSAEFLSHTLLFRDFEKVRNFWSSSLLLQWNCGWFCFPRRY